MIARIKFVHLFTQILNSLLFNGIKNGSVKPICRVVFSTDDVEKCFRYMAAGKHMGKVLFKIRDEEDDKVGKPTTLKINAIPKYNLISIYF